MSTEFKNRRIRKRKNNSLANLLIFFAFLFFAADVFFAYIKGVRIRAEKQQQIITLQKRLEDLNKTNKNIEQNIYTLSKKQGIEKSAREMGLVKPGEVQFRVVETDGK